MTRVRWSGTKRITDLNGYVRINGGSIKNSSIYERVAHVLRRNGFAINRGETAKAFCNRMKDEIIRTNTEDVIRANTHDATRKSTTTGVDDKFKSYLASFCQANGEEPRASTQLAAQILRNRGIKYDADSDTAFCRAYKALIEHEATAWRKKRQADQVAGRTIDRQLAHAIPNVLALIGYIQLIDHIDEQWRCLADWLTIEHPLTSYTKTEVSQQEPFPDTKTIVRRNFQLVIDLEAASTQEQIDLYNESIWQHEELANIQRRAEHQAQQEQRQRELEEERQRELEENFLTSYYWRQARMRVLKRDGRRCACCGATPANGATMHVDHIKPRRHYPELALDEDNLQVLCHECNHGKGNWDETDWRTPELEMEAVEDVLYGIAGLDYNQAQNYINTLKMHELQACLLYVIQAIKPEQATQQPNTLQ